MQRVRSRLAYLFVAKNWRTSAKARGTASAKNRASSSASAGPSGRRHRATCAAAGARRWLSPAEQGGCSPMPTSALKTSLCQLGGEDSLGTLCAPSSAWRMLCSPLAGPVAGAQLVPGVLRQQAGNVARDWRLGRADMRAPFRPQGQQVHWLPIRKAVRTSAQCRLFHDQDGPMGHRMAMRFCSLLTVPWPQAHLVPVGHRRLLLLSLCAGDHGCLLSPRALFATLPLQLATDGWDGKGRNCRWLHTGVCV